MAIALVIKTLGYKRRLAIKKGFLDDPNVIDVHLLFTEEGITWDRQCVACILFSNKVWIKKGAHTVEWITM